MSCSTCNQLTCCGCGNQSTQQVCGDFDINPDNPDLGQCSPYRSKRTCAAPTIPPNPCDDDDVQAISRPGQHPPFAIVAGLFDENCERITDENGAPIITLIVA